MLRNLGVVRRLRIWQKLVLITVMMGLPIPFITYLLVAEKNKNIDVSQREIYGVQYLIPLKNLSRELARYRSLSFAVLRGTATYKTQVEESAKLIDQHFGTLEEIDQRKIEAERKTYGSLLQTTGRVRVARKKWAAIKSRALTARAEEQAADLSQLNGDMMELMRQVGDQSTLILDPDLDSYYLMEAVVIGLPEVADKLEEMRGLGLGIATSSSITQREIARISELQGAISSTMNGTIRGLNEAYRFNPNLLEKHGDQIRAIEREITNFSRLIQDRLVEAKSIDIPPAEVFTFGATPIDQLEQFENLSMEDLEAVLKKRIATIASQRNTALWAILGGLLGTVLIVYRVVRGITMQLGEIGALIKNIDKGEIEARANVLSNDELGETAFAFNNMLDGTRGLLQSRDQHDRIQNSIMKLLDEVSGVADGDLTSEAEVSDDITGAMADAFNYMIAELRQIISRVQDVTEKVNSSATRTQSETEEIARGSQEQVQRISRTSAALDRMTTQMHQVSEDAVLCTTVADQALGAARRGADAVQNTVKGMARIQEQVHETSNHMQQLEERSQEIEEIVQLIDEIADRTGVLALNASIQASTAGEAGAGFAVVAAEVEQLAGRSTEATRKISNLVKAIQGGTGEAISAMKETTREVMEGARLARVAGQSLDEIEQVSCRLAELVKSISAASREQASGSETLSKSMADIAEITQQTASNVMQSAASVRTLAELADQLNRSITSFKLPGHNGNGHHRKGI